MDELQLDPELHETLKGIRESVRRLFEQLRLKNTDGDISGKERLERVPALAKRNFANLGNANPLRAAKEAWRLIDFLEGNDEGRLSPLAREALRVVELDKRLAALRASTAWREAAMRLREALGVGHRAKDIAPPSASDSDPDPGDGALSGCGPRSDTAAQEPGLAPAPRAARRSRRVTAFVMSALAAIGLAGGAWRLGRSGDDPGGCIAIESASHKLLARHRTRHFGEALPRPPRGEAKPRVITISDPPDGSDVRSTWSTSQFSFAESSAPQRPGGGKSDYRLRVGGWGDTYVSLLMVPVPSDRLAHKAVLQLTVMGDEPSSRPTPMTLRAIRDHWRVGPEAGDRLWWRDCPASDAIANHLPPPGPRGSIYEIDITDLYNHWVVGFSPPYGIMLEPEQIGSWKPGRPHYPSFSTFYSTRARDPINRPRLVITY